MYNLVEGVDNNNKCSSVDGTYNNTDTKDESNIYVKDIDKVNDNGKSNIDDCVPKVHTLSSTIKYNTDNIDNKTVNNKGVVYWNNKYH